MDELDVCREIEGYSLVRELMHGRAEKRSFEERLEICQRYRHALSCGDCRERFVDAYEEYRFGNEEFDEALFHRNARFIEELIGF